MRGGSERLPEYRLNYRVWRLEGQRGRWSGIQNSGGGFAWKSAFWGKGEGKFEGSAQNGGLSGNAGLERKLLSVPWRTVRENGTASKSSGLGQWASKQMLLTG
jgi:hypothetical protein